MPQDGALSLFLILSVRPRIDEKAHHITTHHPFDSKVSIKKAKVTVIVLIHMKESFAAALNDLRCIHIIRKSNKFKFMFTLHNAVRYKKRKVIQCSKYEEYIFNLTFASTMLPSLRPRIHVQSVDHQYL